MFFLSFFFPALFQIAWLLLLLLLIAVIVDSFLVFGRKDGVITERIVADRFSIGDENKVSLRFSNRYNFPTRISVIDEIPIQFQERNWMRKMTLESGGQKELDYFLKPLTRGEYIFHDINVFVHAPLGLVRRHLIFPAEKKVKVYPSFIQMRRYQLLALSNKLQEAGVKRIRRLGHSMEFEQIKEYVRGDDYRTINWKATARNDKMMVNNFTDERSQQVYCLINKGRLMKMPFQGMTLLDYSINASLVLSNVALVKQDRAGLITF